MSARSLSRRSLLRTGVVVGAGAVGLPLAGLVGRAGAATTIASCAEWGARPSSQPVVLLGTNPNKIIVHHTATANSTDYSQAHAFALAQSIQRFHMDTRGFIDTGQHFTISRGGYTMEGRHRSLERLRLGQGHIVGAHCTGQNEQSIGIENEGTYTSVAPTDILYARLVDLCADICQQYGLPASQIYGHRDFNSTECPGDVLYARLPQLRSEVAGRILVWPTVARGATGERVRTVQYLLRQAGQTLTVDGSFGPATEAAVRAFQQSRGLAQTGVVNGATWTALIVTVRSGSTGEAVKAVQSQLNTRGYGLTVDGAFGARTDAAVRDFQTQRNLGVDGVVGRLTWNALVS
jgi:N-acetyl-anhydromuramyl-L-alanine amidase AmpD